MLWKNRDEKNQQERSTANSFFRATRPGQPFTLGNASFELPILYFRDDFFALYFSADAQKVKGLLPSEKLHPVLLPNKKAVVAVGAFNYLETSIGAYGEVIVGIPVVHGKKPHPVAPALLETRYPGFGVLVAHLPVTTQTARDAGRGVWGYTKFVADMHFSITPEFLECAMSEKGEPILTLRVVRKGFYMTDKKPIVSFSVKDGNLIKTVIPQKGAYRQSLSPRGSHLTLWTHPVSESIRELGLSERPILSKYYVERSAILPAGDVVEEGVRPLDGYFGEDREGERTIAYT